MVRSELFCNSWFSIIFFWFSISFNSYHVSSSDNFGDSFVLQEQFFIENNENNSELLLEVQPWPSINALRYGDISEKCMHYLLHFSKAASSFINCSVTNSRPLKYCENCVVQYATVNRMYGAILNDASKPTHNCKEQILRADTIQVSLRTYQFVQEIWDLSNCDRCFQITEVNHTKHYNATEKTVNMLHLVNQTLSCFDHSSNLPLNGSNFNSSVCDNCEKQYSKANAYYEQLEKEKLLCSDLIDAMNYSRLAWAGTYHCSVVKYDKGLVWVITAIVFLLPIFLYLGVVFYDRRFAVNTLETNESECHAST